MATSYTDLINTLELTAGLPESSSRYSAEDMLDTINKSLSQNIVPQLMGLNEEYLLTSVAYSLTINGAKTFPTGFVPLPIRSYGQTIRALSLQADGQTTPTVSIPYVEIRDAQNYSRDNNAISNGIPTGYHFFSNGIKLLGNPSVLSGTLHIQFTLNPSLLVSNNPAAIISTIVWTGTTIALTVPTASIPVDLTSYIGNGQTKLIDVTHTATGSVQLWDVRATRNDSGGTSTFTLTAAADLTANKATELNLMLGASGAELSILPANRTTVTNIPKEFDNLLVLDVAKRIWASLGDIDKASQFNQLYQETLTRLSSAMGTRSKGEPKVISNRSGLLNNLKGRIYGRGWW